MKPPKTYLRKAVLIAAAFLATPSLLLADFSYQQTTQITGGSILSVFKTAGIFSSQARRAGEPMHSAVYLKGNRLANVSAQSIEIIDLDKKTITTADPQKRTWSVMTFDQIRQRAAEAARKAEQAEKEQPDRSEPNEPETPAARESNVKTSFDVNVRRTGKTMQLSGLQAEHAILTMMLNATDTRTSEKGAMGITSDLWLAPEPAGYAEIRAFYARMAREMGDGYPGGGDLGVSRMLASQPGAGEALSDMAKEMQKLKGAPVLQVMRMGMTTGGKPLLAASEAPLPAEASSGSQGPSLGDAVKDSAAQATEQEAGRRVGRLGSFGGVGGSLAGGLSGWHKNKKKQAPPPAENPDTQAQQQAASAPTQAILVEMKSESSNFSTAPIADSQFEVPAGYRQVSPDQGNH